MYRLMKLLKDFKLKVTSVIPNKIWSVGRMKRICRDLIMKKLFQKICLQMIRLKWYWRIVRKISVDMQLCFYLIKLSQNIFVGRKYKKKNTIQKTPSTIRRKIQVLLMCFQKKFINYFHSERGSPPNFKVNLFYH